MSTGTTKTEKLMLYREIRIFSENPTKHMNTLFGHNAQFLGFK